MKSIATLALAAVTGVCLIGSAEALPLAPATTAAAPVAQAAIIVRRVVRRPFVRRPARRVIIRTRRIL